MDPKAGQFFGVSKETTSEQLERSPGPNASSGLLKSRLPGVKHLPQVCGVRTSVSLCPLTMGINGQPLQPIVSLRAMKVILHSGPGGKSGALCFVVHPL